jgi:hypothetical protein
VLVAVAVALAAGAGGCPGGNGAGSGPPLSDTEGQDEPLSRMALLRDLESEVLDGYERDEPLDPQVRVIDPVIGPARIGVGPGDVWFGSQVSVGTSRWPLTTDRTIALDVKSKKLELHMAVDQSAAWVADEVSWRISACDRTAVIPLRFTSLYVRDGDRWSAVVEHLSYGRQPSPDDPPDFGAGVDAGEADPAISAAVDGVIAPMLAVARPVELALAPEAFALGPDIWDELRTDEIAVTPLWPEDLKIEQRRVGVVERSGRATVAYWVGTLLGGHAGGPPIRLRATFVFERRGKEWTTAQAHVSLPVDDPALANAAFGGALAGLNPLRVNCTSR